MMMVEKTTCLEAAADRIVCLKGSRSCPPEDCGGVWGYRELLASLANPTNSEAAEQLKWLEGVYGDFDPEYFDAAEITESFTNFRLTA